MHSVTRADTRQHKHKKKKGWWYVVRFQHSPCTVWTGQIHDNTNTKIWMVIMWWSFNILHVQWAETDNTNTKIRMIPDEVVTSSWLTYIVAWADTRQHKHTYIKRNITPQQLITGFFSSFFLFWHSDLRLNMCVIFNYEDVWWSCCILLTSVQCNHGKYLIAQTQRWYPTLMRMSDTAACSSQLLQAIHCSFLSCK